MSPREQRDAVLRELDRLLAVRGLTKQDKARLIRDVADAAARMAASLERWEREEHARWIAETGGAAHA